MEVFITDYTEMGGGNYCVAGWDANQGRMVRPLPNGRNWSTAQIQQFGISPGVLMQFTVDDAAHPGDFPHTTEDTRVTQAGNLGQRADLWLGQDRPQTANSVQQAFGGNIVWNSVFQGRKQGVHIPVGTNCRSLWGLSINSNGMRFVEEFDKLKCIIDDGDDEYICAVSSAHLKTLFRQGGVNAVNAFLPTNTAAHVRLGLARAFGTQADKCFLMVNGIQI